MPEEDFQAERVASPAERGTASPAEQAVDFQAERGTASPAERRLPGGFPGGVNPGASGGVNPSGWAQGAAGSQGGGFNGGAGSPGQGFGAGQDGNDSNRGQRFDRGAGGGGAGGAFNTGTKGPLRLFQEQLSGQASWMLPFAIIAAAAVLLSWRRRSMSQRHREVLFWLFWLLPVAGFFSIAGFFHSYYLIMLAPPVAALVGAGWSEMWAKYRQGGGWQAYLLPVAIAVTSLFQWYILSAYESTVGLLWPLLIAGAGLITALVLSSLAAREKSVVRIAAAAGLGIMLIGPAYWSATPIVYGENSMIPAAGPDSSAMGPAEGGEGRAASEQVRRLG